MLALHPRSRSCKKALSIVLLAGLVICIVYFREPRSIQESIIRFNKQQKVNNYSKFPRLTNDSIVIVVQVNKRIIYLRHLISSLSLARDISKTLLIFSHDFYDEEINELVQSIDFCKVMQIFYPFSIQTHPNEFPGQSPQDCLHEMKRADAISAKCLNAHFPDTYGHYREAKSSQIKHHWWWKVNRVFDQLEVTKFHTGPVLFLEEDHYVAEDFLHMLKLMQNLSAQFCPLCNIMSLANQETVLNSDTADKVARFQWISNMGIWFTRSAWNEIKSYSKHFCVYDDYNWDWTLQYIRRQYLENQLHIAFLKGPRVFHIGECGFHFDQEKCELNELAKVKDQLIKATPYLYPESLQFPSEETKHLAYVFKPSGGWSDPRDISMCLSMSFN